MGGVGGKLSGSPWAPIDQIWESLRKGFLFRGNFFESILGGRGNSRGNEAGTASILDNLVSLKTCLIKVAGERVLRGELGQHSVWQID